MPLTVLFQLLVARRPLHAVWVRDAPRLRVSTRWVVVSVALAALPVYKLCHLDLRREWVLGCWYACAVLGAFAAAYALQNANRRVARSVSPVAVMVAVVCLLMLFGTLSQKRPTLGSVGNALLTGLTATMLYLPVAFFF